MHAIFTALRQLRKSPAFAITVILTIALGIGANTAIFTLVHAVLLRSLPVQNPKMLYAIGKDTSQGGIGNGMPSDGDFNMFSYDLYEHVRDTTPEFVQLAAVQSGPEGLSARVGSAPAKNETIEYVSGNYFQALGLRAFVGRLLTSRDDTPQAMRRGRRTSAVIPTWWARPSRCRRIRSQWSALHLPDFTAIASAQLLRGSIFRSIWSRSSKAARLYSKRPRRTGSICWVASSRASRSARSRQR
jgi:hypothetical protein